jgi:hypothetical protein
MKFLKQNINNYLHGYQNYMTQIPKNDPEIFFGQEPEQQLLE